MNEPARYRLSFTTGGLLATEARTAAGIQQNTSDWDLTRAQLRADNPLGIRTAAAVTRVSREVVDRLRVLSEGELAVVVDGSSIDRQQLLWVAVTRQYQLIHEFALEVVRRRFLEMTPRLTLDHFDAFLTSKAAWAPEIAALAETTRRKLRQNLFRMMREADITDTDGQIQPTLLSATVESALAPRGAEALLVFPMTDDQISRALR